MHEQLQSVGRLQSEVFPIPFAMFDRPFIVISDSCDSSQTFFGGGFNKKISGMLASARNATHFELSA